MARGELYDNNGGDVPEYDENGNPIVKTTKVNVLRRKKLDKKAKVANMLQNAGAKPQPFKMYDVSKLKLETFRKVLEYITENLQQGRKKPPVVPANYDELH